MYSCKEVFAGGALGLRLDSWVRAQGRSRRSGFVIILLLASWMASTIHYSCHEPWGSRFLLRILFKLGWFCHGTCYCSIILVDAHTKCAWGTTIPMFEWSIQPSNSTCSKKCPNMQQNVTTQAASLLDSSASAASLLYLDTLIFCRFTTILCRLTLLVGTSV